MLWSILLNILRIGCIAESEEISDCWKYVSRLTFILLELVLKFLHMGYEKLIIWTEKDKIVKTACDGK